ncbi:MAG: GatB/YqeY domain-containing protein, partial [Acidobacteriaceae bacterium]
MELVKQIDRDMIAAMKAHDVERTQTLRMAKSALKNKAIEKRGDLTDAEAQQVFNTMIKQRKESIEQFM